MNRPLALERSYEPYERPGLVVSYKIAGGAVIKKGALLGLDIHGYCRTLADPDCHTFIGVANDSADNSKGENGDRSVNATLYGSFVYAVDGTPGQHWLGLKVYQEPESDYFVTPKKTEGCLFIGKVVGIERTSTGHAGVRVKLNALVEG